MTDGPRTPIVDVQPSMAAPVHDRQANGVASGVRPLGRGCQYVGATDDRSGQRKSQGGETDGPVVRRAQDAQCHLTDHIHVSCCCATWALGRAPEQRSGNAGQGYP